MTLAILLSGQGGQHAGMFGLTADAPEATPIFEAATEALGHDPRDLPEGEMHANRAGQVLCVTAALAAWAVLREAVPARSVVAGYSIGDLAAWGVAGRIAPGELLALTVARAEAMDAASPPDHGLAGLRGLPLGRIAALAEDHGAHLAIRNARDSAVVGGARDALAALCRAALSEGAEAAKLLDVAVPSHTPLLKDATEAFRDRLQGATLAEAPPDAPRLIAGLDGGTVFDGAQGLDKLARQISETIDWRACLAACDEFGATRVLELGPGHALATMARHAMPDAEVRALEDFRSAEGVRRWISEGRGGW